MNTPLLARFAPALFVLLWSTGWIVGRAIAPFAEPLWFLVVRYLCAIAVLLVFALVTKASWPRSRMALMHMLVSGVLLHAIYLGGVWVAIKQGLPTPVSAVIAALQPILTCILAPLLINETITRKQALGVFIGFTGILLVLAPKLLGVEFNVTVWPLLINCIGMVAVTFGTFYQKRFLTQTDLRTTTLIQFFGALLVTLPVAWLVSPYHIIWNTQTVISLVWSVFGLSIGAIGLLLYLIKRGEVSRSAALIFLIPPTAALESYLLFSESLAPLQLLGMGVTVLGVFLTLRK